MREDPRVAAQDETPKAMNRRLEKLANHALGFGVLEGKTKQQLAKLKRPPAFFAFTRTNTTFNSVENTATAQGFVQWKQLAESLGIGLDLVVRHGAHVDRQTVSERSIVVFSYVRVLAKRSIDVPLYKKLLPVKKKTHLDKNRWLVELYGNQLCTTEYYGGQARIVFTWNREAKMSTAYVIQAIDTMVGSNETNAKRFESSQMADLRCQAHVEGFELPESLKGNLTTVSSIMELIRVLNQLPIRCAVPVDRDVVPIQSTCGFPSGIEVETHIRDVPMLEKLAELQLQLRSTEPVNVEACELLEYARCAVEDASLNNRPALPHLRALVSSLATTLAMHGKRVQLYKRGDELRLHTDGCSGKNVTASATEVLFALTLGTAIPLVRSCQHSWFEAAPVWTVPPHYSAVQFATTGSVSGYYDRIKVLLLFNDKDQVLKWRREVDELSRRRPKPRMLAVLFGART